jgi:hypothetical protein
VASNTNKNKEDLVDDSSANSVAVSSVEEEITEAKVTTMKHSDEMSKAFQNFSTTHNNNDDFFNNMRSGFDDDNIILDVSKKDNTVENIDQQENFFSNFDNVEFSADPNPEFSDINTHSDWMEKMWEKGQPVLDSSGNYGKWAASMVEDPPVPVGLKAKIDEV